MSTFSAFTGDGGDTLGFESTSAAAEAKTEVPAVKDEVVVVVDVEAPVAGAPVVVVGGNRNICLDRELPRATRDWSHLPKPATQLILMGLRPALGDAFSFAGVCKAWRSVFTDCKGELFSSLPPLLVDCGSSPDLLVLFYSFVEQRFFRQKQPIPWRWFHTSGSLCLSDWCVIGVSHGYWIITPKENSERRPVFLLDPLFPESRIKLPPASHFWFGQAFFVRKFNRALMTAPPTSPDCVVVAMETYCIWYCRPGDTEWVCHDFSSARSNVERVRFALHQVAVLGHRLYALARNRNVVVMELLFPRPRITVVNVEGLPFDHRELGHLVESDGEILYIADEGGGRGLIPSDVLDHLDELDRLVGPDGAIPYITDEGGPWGLFDGVESDREFLYITDEGCGRWDPFIIDYFEPERPCVCEHRYVVWRLDLLARRWVALATLGKRSIFLPRHQRGAHSPGTPLTCVGAAEWGGREDCIYSDCVTSGTLVVWSMKDTSAKHHLLPKKLPCWEWLVPSFCCR